MGGHASISSLVIVILTAFFIPILLNKFKIRFLPVVVAEIIAGIIIGKSGFDIVHAGTWLDILSVLGFIFLMFLSGLEIDFSVFAASSDKKQLPNGKTEPNRLGVSSVIFALIFVVSFALSMVFVWTGFTDNAFFMTLIISTISLGVVVPTLKEEDLSRTAIGQIILIIAVIADLVTMILLAVFVSLQSGDSGQMWLLLILFGAGIILYFIGKYMRHHTFLETLSKGTVQIDTRAVFTLIIVLVGVSESVGAENILGAFLAGVLVSLLSPNQHMVHKLDSFGYGFLIPIFFVMIGVELDLVSVVKDPKVLILIPLLLLGLLVSKFIPILVLRKWYDWKTVIASGFLLTSTLSLVIAAAKIGERIKVIDARTSSALILTAVISCIITPVFFKKLLPRKKTEKTEEHLAIIGANQFTLPVLKELESGRFEKKVYHTKQLEKDPKQLESFDIIELDDYSVPILKASGAFDTDILVVATGEDGVNESIAQDARSHGIKRVITRIEDPVKREELLNQNIEVYSAFFSSQVLLKMMIENPSVVSFLSRNDHSLYELVVKNGNYHKTALRNFPHFGDAIIVRIFRGKDSIVPHGDTEILIGDKLIVTGSKEHIEELKRVLR
ncbi:monovalent cation:proton antiporter family protein [Fictibacillus terranigra]|uniref:Monovalent cation:proton antiporter family protein n=1 Tax=Fictibacillus terranigra TaxID=3058424 RepID=A0ABT8E6Y0_9BACL|nr:monovalent cation:proton antiporter family protein [Fictibacillus sp. CENA-BCM004]MDN4073673.1 monovalent cation:proton antiporter family protein [Fictibacillus sp. CENA-BCM004]